MLTVKKKCYFHQTDGQRETAIQHSPKKRVAACSEKSLEALRSEIDLKICYLHSSRAENFSVAG